MRHVRGWTGVLMFMIVFVCVRWLRECFWMCCERTTVIYYSYSVFYVEVVTSWFVPQSLHFYDRSRFNELSTATVMISSEGPEYTSYKLGQSNASHSTFGAFAFAMPNYCETSTTHEDTQSCPCPNITTSTSKKYNTSSRREIACRVGRYNTRNTTPAVRVNVPSLLRCCPLLPTSVLCS